MYKVTCQTYPLLSDGNFGIIGQGTKTFFTDANIETIEKRINTFLAVNKIIAIVEKIEKIDGTMLKV